MHFLYNAVLYPLRAVAAAWSAWAGRDPAQAAPWAERRARRLPSAPPGGVWLHGASLGEARLVAAISRALDRARPGIVIAASALTPAGRAALPETASARFFLPLDVAAWQRRVLEALDPAALVLVETELWPNLVREAERRGVPVCLVNARLAPERMSRYRRLRALYGPLIARLSRIGAQTAQEAARFAELGADPAVVVVTGNVKYDLPVPEATRASVRAALGLSPSRPVVAAGSTGDGEDALVLDAFAALRRARPDAFLVLAPRHAVRFEDAARRVVARGLTLHRLSEAPESAAGAADVLLVDAMGRLAALYAAADAAFVGGSLVPVGGHNVLEPAACGVPVLFGPHTHHVALPAEALERAGGAVRVADAAALGQAWADLISDPGRRKATANAAAGVVEANRGALDRTAALILEVARR